jgi:hypothetical protein
MPLVLGRPRGTASWRLGARASAAWCGSGRHDRHKSSFPVVLDFVRDSPRDDADACNECRRVS